MNYVSNVVKKCILDLDDDVVFAPTESQEREDVQVIVYITIDNINTLSMVECTEYKFIISLNNKFSLEIHRKVYSLDSFSIVNLFNSILYEKITKSELLDMVNNHYETFVKNNLEM